MFLEVRFLKSERLIRKVNIAFYKNSEGVKKKKGAIFLSVKMKKEKEKERGNKGPLRILITFQLDVIYNGIRISHLSAK